jgi:hypothetical protein
MNNFGTNGTMTQTLTQINIIKIKEIQQIESKFHSFSLLVIY